MGRRVVVAKGQLLIAGVMVEIEVLIDDWDSGEMTVALRRPHETWGPPLRIVEDERV